MTGSRTVPPNLSKGVFTLVESLERIRAANRRREHKYIFADKSHLVKELDERVMDMIEKGN